MNRSPRAGGGDAAQKWNHRGVNWWLKEMAGSARPGTTKGGMRFAFPPYGPGRTQGSPLRSARLSWANTRFAPTEKIFIMIAK